MVGTSAPEVTKQYLSVQNSNGFKPYLKAIFTAQNTTLCICAAFWRSDWRTIGVVD